MRRFLRRHPWAAALLTVLNVVLLTGAIALLITIVTADWGFAAGRPEVATAAAAAANGSALLGALILVGQAR